MVVCMKDVMHAFIVKDEKMLYFVILVMDWIQVTKCVPLTLHQKFMLV